MLNCLKLVEVLRNDIEKLKRDISVYESHIQKTELWCDNMGKWKTKVVGMRQQVVAQPGSISSMASSSQQGGYLNGLSASSAMSASMAAAASSSGGGGGGGSGGEIYYPLFEIHVELCDDDGSDSSSDGTAREGWVIYRSFRQFEALNTALIELIPLELKAKFKRIPSASALRQRTAGQSVRLDEERARHITAALDDYLRAISLDESLAQSEALYTFLCPSPDYFKRLTGANTGGYTAANGASGDEKFSIGSIFKMYDFKCIIMAKFLI